MRFGNLLSRLGFVLSLLVVGCQADQGRPQSGSSSAPQSAAPKRVVAAVAGDPPTVHAIVSRASQSFSIPGNDIIQRMVLSGLSTPDDHGILRPQLGEAVPSIENGLWRVEPDGTMETTWKIKSGARWHDGTPLTADDFLFGLDVVRDRELVVFRDPTYDGILSAEAPSPDVITVKWKEPYIFADMLFATIGWPFPKHLLADVYATDKDGFLQHAYWAEDYVGTGPYKLKEFARSTRVVLTANESYLLGRPKIDEIEVRFILDSNVVQANILAGEVDLTFGRLFPLSSGEEIRRQWQGGTVLVGGAYSRIHMEPQHLDPNPAIVGDVRFRKALMHGLDRQQMADTLQYGLVPVADSLLAPDQPEYEDTLPVVVRYEYDARRASQMLEGLGYRRGGDGNLRDAANQPLSLEIRVTSENPLSNKTMYVVTDYWKQLGLTIDPTVIPAQRIPDREYLATFPTFHFRRQGAAVPYLVSLMSRNAQLPSNNYVGSNYSRYMNPEFDTAVLRFYSTIDRSQRMEVLKPIIRQISDEVILMGLFYDTTVTVVNNRVRGVTAANQGWNVEDWST